MNIERIRCETCNRPERACSECGSMHVSVDGRRSDDFDSGHEFGPDFEKFATAVEAPAVLRYALVCWDCGTTEERALRLEVVDDA